jgi:hypothetical protein
MLKRLISPFSKLLIRGCVSLKNSAASAMLDCPPERRYASRQRKRVFTLAKPTDPEALLPGLLQGPVNADRLAFVHRDRIQHERRGDRLVGAIAGQITPQAISGGLVIVYDVSVVENLHSQGKELCTFGTPGIVQVSDDRELIAFSLAARVIGLV